MKTHQVFLSYSHADRKFAEKIAAYLQENGVKVWWDKWEILAGDSLIQKIFEEGLIKCDVFLILLSSESVKSNWVQRELDVAMVKKIEGITKIIPIIIEKCDIPNALKPLKWIDISSNFDSGMRELLKGIFEIREKPSLGYPPDFVISRTHSIGGLSPEATNLAEFLTQDSDDKQPFEKMYDVKQLAELLKFTPQEMNDAIEELESHGLVRSLQVLGTQPFDYAQVEPTYALYLHLRDLITRYDPENDIKIIASAIVAKEQLSGLDIQEITKLPPSRINRAIGYLEDYGIIQVLKFLGTVPFVFGRAMATGVTRRFVREKCQ
jgi:hypothetical protein